jgi:hypothetical protein
MRGDRRSKRIVLMEILGRFLVMDHGYRHSTPWHVLQPLCFSSLLLAPE